MTHRNLDKSLTLICFYHVFSRYEAPNGLRVPMAARGHQQGQLLECRFTGVKLSSRRLLRQRTEPPAADLSGLQDGAHGLRIAGQATRDPNCA
jgi:hypothetical protein